MPLTPLSQALAANRLQLVQLVATDMDGTLTVAGKFTSILLQALERLNQAEIPVLIVTGRSAGWVSAVVNYLPVWGAIAENGGVVFTGRPESTTLLAPIRDIPQHRRQLAAVFQRLQSKFPQIQETADNAFRLTDWTFDIQGLSQDEIQHMGNLCQEWGWGFTYSTVQCHIKLAHQEKAIGLQQVLYQSFPAIAPAQVLTVGDSPNDVSLFDCSQFPLSVGVANVMDYSTQLIHQPAYITTNPEGEGFWELTQALLASD
ncbi:HAD family phosphatase [Leptothermofonsia sichuanensis E412]|uniref:HAD-IIB family hydrolase n=1 Tax=Leptothermofonsia sichuanensis TaxID=2917832 RepID=UPI001CA79F68|nr:HAD family hydrolase [Leptothermofonsia sichuanensis]QZZ19304.1 HAD family phosphatase [Leptothermofonsia sichuanensis E412]